jgi:hypothetical protein
VVYCGTLFTIPVKMRCGTMVGAELLVNP